METKKMGHFLKELRNEKGITQEKFAEQFGVSNRTVSRWETGTNSPDISLLANIADFYEVDVRELLEGGRNEKMQEENKKILEANNVAKAMAGYAQKEKGKLLSVIQILSVISIIAILSALIFQAKSFQPGIASTLGIFFTFIAMLLAMIVSLYVNGILKKIAKNKSLIMCIKILSIVLFIVGVYTILWMSFFYAIGAAESNCSFQDKSDIENYDKTSLIEKYGTDLASEFAVFPDNLDDSIESEYYQKARSGLLDTDGFFALTAKYEETDYQKEIKRLESLGCKEDDSSYYYPAYIAMDGYDYTYEYALTDEKTETIIYIAISYPQELLDSIPKTYQKYLKQDFTSYDIKEDEVLTGFTIY